ncbi:hypothetical protein BDQ17DRAFT_172368 [Cyathus striatus]|nr:hypothetical protein BDQ17DRAFT_172368 [Cyathus striatus]
MTRIIPCIPGCTTLFIILHTCAAVSRLPTIWPSTKFYPSSINFLRRQDMRAGYGIVSKKLVRMLWHYITLMTGHESAQQWVFVKSRFLQGGVTGTERMYFISRMSIFHY